MKEKNIKTSNDYDTKIIKKGETFEKYIEYNEKEYQIIKVDKDILVAKKVKESILDEEDKKTIKMAVDLMIRCGSKKEDIKVKKCQHYNAYYIIMSCLNSGINLNDFDKRFNMYKNMELYKPYNLKELGIE